MLHDLPDEEVLADWQPDHYQLAKNPRGKSAPGIETFEP